MRINQLTFFRFLAAVLVVAFHFGRQTAPFNSTIALPFVDVLDSAVSFFFVLSGFVLAVSSRDNLVICKRTFYFNRLLRIYPLYALALVILLLPKFIDGPGFKGISIKHLIMNLSLTQAIFSDNALSLNFPGWSLSVEFCFYLLFPFFFSFLAKKSTREIIGFCSVFWLFSIASHAFVLAVPDYVPQSYAIYFPAVHLSTFVLGVGTGLIYCRHTEYLNRKKVELLVLTLALASIFGALIATENPLIKLHHCGLFNPLFISTILLFSLDRAPFKKLLTFGPLIALGEASYGIYILQYPLRRLLLAMGVSYQLPWLSNFYVGTIFLIACSVICYFWFERPIINRFKMSKSRNGPTCNSPVLAGHVRHR